MITTLVIGSINMDVVNKVHHMPLPGETVLGESVSYNPGGKGANQAVAAARMGCHVIMLGAVGSDMFSNHLLTNLKDNNIDTSFVKQSDGPSSMAFITVDDSGENSIIVAPGANQTLTNSDLFSLTNTNVFNECDTLIVQNEIPLETTLAAMKLAHNHGVQVIFNPAPITHVTLECLEHVDVIILNKTETEVLVGDTIGQGLEDEKIQEVFRTILHAGPSAAVITLGKVGAMYGTFQKVDESNAKDLHKTEDGLVLIREKAYDVSVVDTTAAGDTFVGAFASKYKSTSDAVGALRFASAASALAVTKEGAQASTPFKDDVIHFLEK